MNQTTAASARVSRGVTTTAPAVVATTIVARRAARIVAARGVAIVAALSGAQIPVVVAVGGTIAAIGVTEGAIAEVGRCVALRCRKRRMTLSRLCSI
jgi:hypothetical protein